MLNIKILLIACNSLKFLEKYGFNIISLDKDTLSIYELDKAKKLIRSGKIRYIYSLENLKDNDHINNLIRTEKLDKINLRNLDTITDKERKNRKRLLYYL